MHADELATTGLRRLRPKQRVPIDPDTKVQLHFRDMTITRNLKPTVRELLQSRELQEYYCRRFNWTIDIFDSVDWELFTPVYRKKAKKNLNFTNKYGIKTLPTGERMRRRCGNEDERCCSCGQAIETDDHLFQCKKRQQYQRQILGAVKRAEKGMEPNLHRLLKTGIKNYLDGKCDTLLHTCRTMMESTPNRAYPYNERQTDLIYEGLDDGPYSNKHSKYQEYHLLLAEQEVIGWDNLLRGKFSKEWRRLQREYEATQTMKKKAMSGTIGNNTKSPEDDDDDSDDDDDKQGNVTKTKKTKKKKKKKRKTDRFRKLTSTFFETAWKSMWEQRNKDRHQPDNKTNHSAT